MEYKIQDIEKKFVGQITQNLGNNEYVISIDGTEHQLRILNMDSRGVEFILNQQHHTAKYIENSVNEMSLVVDNVPILVNMNSHFDGIVYKNSGGSDSGSAQLSLKSQIPGKVISIAISDGDSIKKGDIVCTLESMKMQVAVKSHKDGTVKSIRIKEGISVAKGDIIAEIE